MEYKEIKGKVIFIFISILAISFFIYKTNKNEDNLHYNALCKVLNEEYSGTITTKDYDKTNHNSPVIFLKNDNQKIYVFSEIWIKIMIGDSVVKKKNNTYLSVFRNGKNFTLDNIPIIDNQYLKNKSG